MAEKTSEIKQILLIIIKIFAFIFLTTFLFLYGIIIYAIYQSGEDIIFPIIFLLFIVSTILLIVYIPKWNKKRKLARLKQLHYATETILNNPSSFLEKEKETFLLPYANIFPFVDVLRRVQIIRDSIELIKNSKNINTINSRYNLILEISQELSSYYPHILPETAQLINYHVEQSKQIYHTQKYLKPALSYMKRADKLKTLKGKQKNWDKAKQIILEGLNDPLANKADLEKVLKLLQSNLEQ